MGKIRRPAVAGMFYPGDAEQLASTVRSLLERAQATPCNPRAIIAPHAGYVYSGPIAASVYAPLAAMRDQIRRVVLLGPSHRVPFRGVALPESDRFETPLGTVRVDTEHLDRIRRLPQVCVLEEAHAREHSLEVQLPFLQTVLAEFTLAPLAVGQASPEEVAGVLRELAGGPDTLTVISTDLSHYKDYKTAQAMDKATSQAILDLAPERIKPEDACGRHAVNGLLVFAHETGLKPRTIDLRNSGDTAGDKSQVVGYGAYVFE